MPLKILIQCLLMALMLKSFSSQGLGINETHWWAGIKGGINFTQPHVIESYSIIESIGNPQRPSKIYHSLFKNSGVALGFSIDYSFREWIALSVQPSFQRYRYSYAQTLHWNDTTLQKVTLDNKHSHSLSYIEIPLFIKLGKSFGRFRGHLQIGGFYGFLLNAHKLINSHEQVSGSGELINSHSFNEYFNITTMTLSSQVGLMGGGGVSVDINYFRVALECNYRMGMNNITKVSARYDNARMTYATYDLLDDVSLNNLEFVLHCSTPLDYLIHMPGFSGKPVRR